MGEVVMAKAGRAYLLAGTGATVLVVLFLSHIGERVPAGVFIGQQVPQEKASAIGEQSAARVNLQSTLQDLQEGLQAAQEHGQVENWPADGSLFDGEAGILTTLPSPVLNSLVQAAIRTVQGQDPTSGMSQRNKNATSLCSRFSDAFAAPPSIIQLPMVAESTLEGAELNQTNSLYFTVVSTVPSIAPANGTSRDYSLYVYTQHDIVSDSLQSKNAWENGEVSRTLDQLYRFAQERGLQPGNVTFIDIGANIGTHTLAVAAHGFRVVAFEPLLSNALALRLSMCLNPGMEELITLINKGLAETPTNCTLISGIENAGDGFLRCGNDSVVIGPGYAKRATLGVTRLDDALRPLLPSIKGRVGAVKMDVEGYEPLVVAGGTGFFRDLKPPYVVSECDDAMIEGGTGKPAGQYLAQMSKLGYSVHNASMAEIPAAALKDTACGFTATVYFKPRPLDKREIAGQLSQ